MSQELGSFLAAAGIIAGVALFVPCVQWVVRGWEWHRTRREAAKSSKRTEFSEEVA